MARRHCQLRVCDPEVFLLLPATPLAHRHARILRTIPVDHTLFCFTYPDLHHRLLGVIKSADDECTIQWPHNKSKSYSHAHCITKGAVAVQRELLAQPPKDDPPQLQSTS